MAATFTPGAPLATGSGGSQLHQGWGDANSYVVDQINHGIASPVVDLKKLNEFDTRKIKAWAAQLAEALNVRIEAAIDLYAESVTVHLVAPMQTATVVEPTVEGELGATDDAGKVAEKKVPRPPNAFILYRKDWHTTVVKAHPGLHNNDISKIIGAKWKKEPEEVRSQYQYKANDMKRQHAVDHPGYQYQPRKPSEKKKRMTKNKLAKLNAQADAPTCSVLTKDLSNMCRQIATEEHAAASTAQASLVQDLPALEPSQELDGHLTFDATRDPDGLLFNQLLEWNANNPLPAALQFSAPPVFMGQPLADGRKVVEAQQPDLPFNIFFNDFHTDTAALPDTINPTVCVHNPIAEVERQDYIHEDVMGDFFDFEVCSAPAMDDQGTGNVAQNSPNGFSSHLQQGYGFKE